MNIGRGMCNILVGKSDETRNWYRWGDHSEVDNKEIVCEIAGWISLAQDRVEWHYPFIHQNAEGTGYCMILFTSPEICLRGYIQKFPD
jgi:hypothetical protein